MKRILILFSFFLNFLLIFGGLLFLFEKGVIQKALRVFFYEGRIPYFTPSHAMNRYYETRRNLFRVQLDGERPILLLGDSHTAIPDWTALLGAPIIAARGIEGDTTIGLISRLGDYAEMNPKSVVIWIGTNDVMQGEDGRLVAERILEAVQKAPQILNAGQSTANSDSMGLPSHFTGERVRLAENSKLVPFSDPEPTHAYLPEPLDSLRALESEVPAPDTLLSPLVSMSRAPEIFVMSIPPLGSWVEKASDRNRVIRIANSILAEQAINNGYNFIDLSAALEDEHGFTLGEMTSDGVHLSAQGYQAVIAAIKKSLNEN